ncbi:MAG: DEAD/DEAH box helicase [Deltaproteobacteria bacterium]|nr:DEAD/DEAH box helicase [Deltaproteobacteria bacterium]
MDGIDLVEIIGPALTAALEKKGFTELTPVQLAVLDPAHANRDLRISSQTGSGKTVAIGLALRELAQKPAPTVQGVARPRILIVAPTRELAKQVEEELSWLYAPIRVRVASATGGASYRTERKALGSSPSVVVGTPGRLLDHLGRGVIDARELGAVVLDEADRMLEMGFRDELDAILAYAPGGHQTHLVSATFPRDVKALADRVQPHAVHVEGTRLGEANTDIEHVVHLIDPDQRIDALVNLLLANPDEQTLIFARTRVDVARIADELDEAGFAVRSLSGDMEQAARDRALASFRTGETRALVATDVAARGIDVLAIARVIHADPPTDANSYTHRSGRTGRAGRKGTSSVLVPVALLKRTLWLLRAAGVQYRLEPIPTAASIAAVADERLVAELTAEDPEGFPGYDARTWSLAKHLANGGETTRVIARLLTRVKYAGATQPREVRAIKPPPTDRKPPSFEGVRRKGHGDFEDGWVQFRVTWGKVHGAETRRLLAVVCRRGGIEGSDVGTIRVGPTFSSVEVRARVAEAFALAARKPDPRNPRVEIRQDSRDDRKPPPRDDRKPPPRDDRKPPPRDDRKEDPRGKRKKGGEAPPRKRRPG